MSLFRKLKEKFVKQAEVVTTDDVKQNTAKTETIKEVKKYEKGLSKSRDKLNQEILSVIKKHRKIDAEFFEELEEIMIMADIGVNTVMDLIDKLQARVKSEKIEDAADLKEIIIDELFIIYVGGEIIVSKLNESEAKPSVVLFVGVNGVGKTTTIGKVAHQLLNENKKVMLIAADTFRAGAIEQLVEWGNRLGINTFTKEETTDPSSVIYDGLEEALENGVDYVLIDTAGRLQNKAYLMDELAKINRTINKVVPGAPHETLLVIDATTGQNGINQAKEFKEITNITGIVLTKLDGTAKGGIVIAIKEAVNIPVKYVGLGEAKEDLHVFDIEKYIYSLFRDLGVDDEET